MIEETWKSITNPIITEDELYKKIIKSFKYYPSEDINQENARIIAEKLKIADMCIHSLALFFLPDTLPRGIRSIYIGKITDVKETLESMPNYLNKKIAGELHRRIRCTVDASNYVENLHEITEDIFGESILYEKIEPYEETLNRYRHINSCAELIIKKWFCQKGDVKRFSYDIYDFLFFPCWGRIGNRTVGQLDFNHHIHMYYQEYEHDSYLLLLPKGINSEGGYIDSRDYLLRVKFNFIFEDNIFILDGSESQLITNLTRIISEYFTPDPSDLTKSFDYNCEDNPCKQIGPRQSTPVRRLETDTMDRILRQDISFSAKYPRSPRGLEKDMRSRLERQRKENKRETGLRETNSERFERESREEDLILSFDGKNFHFPSKNIKKQREL